MLISVSGYGGSIRLCWEDTAIVLMAPHLSCEQFVRSGPSQEECVSDWTHGGPLAFSYYPQRSRLAVISCLLKANKQVLLLIFFPRPSLQFLAGWCLELASGIGCLHVDYLSVWVCSLEIVGILMSNSCRCLTQVHNSESVFVLDVNLFWNLEVKCTEVCWRRICF